MPSLLCDFKGKVAGSSPGVTSWPPGCTIPSRDQGRTCRMFGFIEKHAKRSSMFICKNICMLKC